MNKIFLLFLFPVMAISASVIPEEIANTSHEKQKKPKELKYTPLKKRRSTPQSRRSNQKIDDDRGQDLLKKEANQSHGV